MMIFNLSSVLHIHFKLSDLCIGIHYYPFAKLNNNFNIANTL